MIIILCSTENQNLFDVDIFHFIVEVLYFSLNFSTQPIGVIQEMGFGARVFLKHSMIFKFNFPLLTTTNKINLETKYTSRNVCVEPDRVLLVFWSRPKVGYACLMTTEMSFRTLSLKWFNTLMEIPYYYHNYEKIYLHESTAKTLWFCFT